MAGTLLWAINWTPVACMVFADGCAREKQAASQPDTGQLAQAPEESSVARLVSMYRSLPGWRSDREPTEAEWSRLIEVAAMVQHEPADLVARSLDAYLAESWRESRGPFLPESRLFLLLRVVFELPETGPPGAFRAFVGWSNWPDPRGCAAYDYNWPLRWDDGRPRLSALYRGAEGPQYFASSEYRYLRSRFPFRPLAPAPKTSDRANSPRSQVGAGPP